MKSYPKYKDSEIDWLEEIPYHWKSIRLKFLASIYTGDKDTVNRVDDGKYPFFVRSQTVERINTYSYDGEAVLTAGDGVGVGKVFHYYNGKFDFHQRVYKISNFEQIDGKYFYYYFMQNFHKEVLKISAKSTVDSLRLPMLQNFRVSFGSLDEQRIIASFLDQKLNQIDTLIVNKKQMIELLKEERAAIINQAVTKGINPDAEMKDSGIEWLGEVPKHWEVKKLKYSLKLITDKNVNGSLLKIGLENIESKTGKYIETDSEFLGEGIKFSKNDLLFGKLRPYLAKVLLSEFEGNAIGDIFVYRAKEQVIPKFAFYRLLSDAYIEVINGSTFGAKMPRASSEFIGELPFPYPSINEQNAIVKYIDERITSIEKTIKITEKEIALIEEYRTALINEAVTGKIKVTESV